MVMSKREFLEALGILGAGSVAPLTLSSCVKGRRTAPLRDGYAVLDSDEIYQTLEQALYLAEGEKKNALRIEEEGKQGFSIPVSKDRKVMLIDNYSYDGRISKPGTDGAVDEIVCETLYEGKKEIATLVATRYEAECSFKDPDVQWRVCQVGGGIRRGNLINFREPRFGDLARKFQELYSELVKQYKK